MRLHQLYTITRLVGRESSFYTVIITSAHSCTKAVKQSSFQQLQSSSRTRGNPYTLRVPTPSACGLVCPSLVTGQIHFTNSSFQAFDLILIPVHISNVLTLSKASLGEFAPSREEQEENGLLTPRLSTFNRNINQQ